MKESENGFSPAKRNRIVIYLGIILILTGIGYLIIQSINDGWQKLFVIPILGLVSLIGGSTYRKHGLIILGSLMIGVGLGLVILFSNSIIMDEKTKTGMSLLTFAFSWLLIPFLSSHNKDIKTWWAFIPFGIISSLGVCFIFSKLRFIDFVLFIVTGTGVITLCLGSIKKWFGMMIPGCLMVGIGPGIYFAWQNIAIINGLTQTGIMLLWFAFGWSLIVLSARVVTTKFVWWPLIPGGILAMVGWGLYIGGNPSEAVGFIGNTGSIVLIIFGVYLLLVRQGIR